MGTYALTVFVSAILIGCMLPSSASATVKAITIGGVLDSEERIQVFQRAVEKLNIDAPSNIHYNSTAIIFQENPIRTAKAVCESVITKQVYAVIASHPLHSSTAPMAISYTCGFYKIPVIGISVRESIFSDMNVHGSFIRTVPPYSEQSRVWLELLKHFKWPSMVIIHSVDQEGRSMLGRLQNHADNLSKEHSIEIEKSVKYVSGQSNYTEELMELMDLQSRVVLLYATTEDAETIYSAAISLGLIGSGYVWIVTEQALLPSNTPYGVIGTLLANSNETDHIEDSVTVIGKAFRGLLAVSNITEDPPHECSNHIWEFGKKVFKNITDTVLENGKTGLVQFNADGDRLNSVYKIVNYKPGKGMVPIGMYNNKDTIKLQMNNEPISWLGNETAKPKGVKISTHLKVVTIQEKPFVYTEEYNEETPETCNIKKKKVPTASLR